MRLRDIIGLGVALVLAIGVAFLTRVFLTKKEEQKQQVLPQQAQATKVLVTTKQLEVGEKLKEGDLAWKEWPQTSLNPNYLTEQSLSTSSMKQGDLTGSVIRTHLNPGEPVVAKDFVRQGDKSVLAALLAPGTRAISIDVSPATASSGLIFPGDFVDVILSQSSTSGGGQQQSIISHTILKNIKVVAIDTNLSAPQDKTNPSPHVATLEVTPTQAEILMASVKEGTLSLSLYSLIKTDTLATPPELAHEPEKRKVTIIRGKETTSIEFQNKSQIN